MSGALARIAHLQGMSEAVWERHANPWSGWTRVPVLPLLAAALFWRDALGAALWPTLGALVVWTILNPRVFPPPRSTASWMSRAVMGERIWLARGEVPVPLHYERAIPIILGFSFAGLPLIGLGLYFEQACPLLMGLVLGMLGKFWVLDRMVWLYDDMCRAHPIYKAWLR
jgi:hypothetical protein